MKEYKIEFKETYMPKSVIRKCTVCNLKQAIDFYGLNEPDIEYWKIIEERDVWFKY